jgi:HK97 family phage portal protein
MLSEETAKYLFGGDVYDPVAGIPINRKTALRHSAVYRCLSLISASVASCAGSVQREDENGDWQDQWDHPASQIFYITPDRSSGLSPFQWIEQTIFECGLVGNNYGEVVSNVRGQGVGIIPLDEQCVEPQWDENGQKFYAVWADPERFWNRRKPDVKLEHDQVFHLRGVSMDGGLTGISPLWCMNEDVSLGQASTRHSSGYMRKGRPLGFVGADDWINEKQEKSLDEQMEKLRKDPWRVMVLGNKARWNNIQLNARDIELMDTRNFQIAEIARFFGVPPILVGLMDRAGFKSVEQLMRGFVTTTLNGWVQRFEHECKLKLFTRDEQFKYRVHMNMDHLQRGDMQAISETWERKCRLGWPLNDWRREEGYKPVKGGDESLVMASQLGKLQDVLDGKYIKSASAGSGTAKARGSGGAQTRSSTSSEQGGPVVVSMADVSATATTLIRMLAELSKAA